MTNHMKVEMAAKSENESFARVVIASFISQLDPTLDELTEVKTVISEAVTNAIIHGYEANEEGVVILACSIEDDEVTIWVQDFGRGIDDVHEAMEPMYTSKPELERSGMGFTIMENFMDQLDVHSSETGTTVTLVKRFNHDHRPIAK
ncbi:anti-sigma F factor [Alkalibacillus sp. S2W]|uniref:Anti-sigma F factor n=1 Tax=Alkalibacillus salilacus TaxID=284582 RepID=A0ABT9VC80_9BACI|nr:MULTISPECIES: anti-sigma F factor [Alkalibacillus]MDQ0158537.1 stage II sporulation protein AB (anti-sigma F factor) [Alkalibacillus salilacus]NIK12356.1 stage II sporulation protein AB (anti-sigma F factor) [Alkalibacillus almallahensis]